MTFHQTVDHPTPGRDVAPVSLRRVRREPPGITAALAAILCLCLLLFSGDFAFAQETPGTPAATPEPDAPRITVEFEELNDSGVSGEATLYEVGEDTFVELEFEDTGENHPAHIHEGTCESIEPEAAYNLENVNEEGASVTLVDVTLDELLDGDFVIDLHISPNELGTLIVCADIEGLPANAEGTPVEVGGPGDPTSEPTATETALDPATEQPDATESAVEAVTQEPTATPVPTEQPTATPTPEPTPEPTATLEPTATPDDSADGTGGAVRPIMSDGTGADSGKGSPLLTAPPPTVAAVGGAASIQGDGTNGQSQTLSGKGNPVGGSTSVMATTGTGPIELISDDSIDAAMWPSGALAISLMLLAMALFIRGAAPSRQSVSRQRLRR